MECERSWEQNAIINELTQGMEVARKLKAELRLASSTTNRDLLVQRILSSYEKALLILKWNGSNSKSQTSSPESPIPVSRSPPMENIDAAIEDHQEHKRCPKRKMVPEWVNQVKVNCENGIEAPHEDRYSWRKYGQKDILGAKHPRSYYRCTFRNTKGCGATKQVQRSDEDPAIFNITYRGSHTCSQGSNALLPPKSPDIQEKPQSPNVYDIKPLKESPTNFRNTLTITTDNLRNEEREMACPFTSPSTSVRYMTQENNSLFPSQLKNNSFLSSLYQTQLLSPNTQESSYFKMNEFDGIYNKPRSESDVTEIISTNTSATNSPFLDFNFDFPLDPVEIDPTFPFNTSGLFT